MDNIGSDIQEDGFVIINHFFTITKQYDKR